jgi:perosamine synthetase
MLPGRIGLIPRYNWDYGIADSLVSLHGLSSENSEIEKTFTQVFGHLPAATTSGRTSLYIILKALDLPPRARIGVPLFCCPVVFDTIESAGFEPEFIDINDDDFSISPADASAKIAALGAIIAVHMFGSVTDMGRLAEVCGKRPIIEDCAHALYSRRNGQFAGFAGTCSFFSFRSGKYLSAGEGSVIFCRDSLIENRVRQALSELGGWTDGETIVKVLLLLAKSLFYHRPLYGLLGLPIGRRMDRILNLSAKEGINLRTIARSDASIIAHRLIPYRDKIMQQRANSLYMLAKLNMRNGVMPTEKQGCESNYYQFPIRFESQIHRDIAADFLLKRGVDTAKYADGIPEIARIRFGYKGDCPVAERCCSTTLVIPNYYSLSVGDLEHVISSLRELDKHLDKVGGK